MEISVNGKQVRLREHIPARGGWEIMHRAIERSSRIPSWDDMIAELQVLVEDWDFPGDPSDPLAYQTLDYFELIPIYKAATEHFGARFQEIQEASKNSAKPST